MNAKLIQEIVHLRGGPVVDPLLPVAKKRRLAESRTSASINANHLSKIGMVAVAMKSNIALQHVPTTLVDCAKFIDNFLDGGGAAFKMEDIWGKRLGESCSWWRTLCSSTSATVSRNSATATCSSASASRATRARQAPSVSRAYVSKSRGCVCPSYRPSENGRTVDTTRPRPSTWRTT